MPNSGKLRIKFEKKTGVIPGPPALLDPTPKRDGDRTRKEMGEDEG